MESTVDATMLAGSVPVADLSLWGLFMQADIIVKMVMLLLIFASFWSWAIIFEKTFRLKRLGSKAEQFEESFWSGGSLEELYDRVSNRPHRSDGHDLRRGHAGVAALGGQGAARRPSRCGPACSSGSIG